MSKVRLTFLLPSGAFLFQDVMICSKDGPEMFQKQMNKVIAHLERVLEATFLFDEDIE